MATGSSVSGPQWTPGVLALVLIAAGCTVTDEFVQDVGTTRITLTAPQLAPQSLTEPQTRTQVAEWFISEACLDLGGTLVDLGNLTQGCAPVAEAECDFIDTVYIQPFSDTRCAGGIVIAANPDEPVKIGLDLTFTMQVRRAVPVDLPPTGNHDGDAYQNGADNCPLVPNDDQRDENMDGIGDDCQLPGDTGGYVMDSDGDGVPDSFDNCVWEFNPGQQNSSEIAEKGINDGIGDACLEQVAFVADNGSRQLTVSIADVDLLQRPRGPTYITVDFADAVDCGDWTGDCRLNPSLVRLCVTNDNGSSGAGCS